jgi:hypothetical protein
MLTILALVGATILPPISVSVRAPGISRVLVAQTLDEASAIWRAAGVVFAWEIADVADGARRELAAPLSDSCPSLCVTIDEGGGPERGSSLAIGWIVFDDQGAPTHNIHLSFGNAMELLRAAEGAGTVSRMTTLEVRTLMSRALGRALAHELGHYLLASKTHTTAGLMKASRSASEFLGPQHDAFAIDPALKTVVSAQLKITSSLARR